MDLGAPDQAGSSVTLSIAIKISKHRPPISTLCFSPLVAHKIVVQELKVMRYLHKVLYD